MNASFTIAREIPYVGNESLLAQETPIDRQWQFLEAVRLRDTDRSFGIPGSRPDDIALRRLTVSTLKGLKGEGGAAELLEICSVNELPSTIVSFLKEVYALYPRPKRSEEQKDEEEESGAYSEDQSEHSDEPSDATEE